MPPTGWRAPETRCRMARASAPPARNGRCPPCSPAAARWDRCSASTRCVDTSLGLGAALQQRYQPRMRIRRQVEVTGGGHVDALQAGGDDIVAVELLRAEIEHGRMVETAASQLDLQCTGAIQHHLGRVVAHSPGREQARQVRTVDRVMCVPPASDGVPVRWYRARRSGSTKTTRWPPAQHVLVDRVLRIRPAAAWGAGSAARPLMLLSSICRSVAGSRVFTSNN